MRKSEIDETTTALQERLAHLDRAVTDLSDIVARQESEIQRLAGRVAMLMEREAAREYDQGGSVPVADRPPPHW